MKKYMFSDEELKVIGDAAGILSKLVDEYPKVIETADKLWILYYDDGGIEREFSEVI